MATNPTDQSDTLIAPLGINSIDGLGGVDSLTINYSTVTRNIRQIYSNQLTDYRLNLITFSNIEKWNILGGIGDDSFYGGGLNDTLLGNSGWDTLSGNGGADSIDGGSGVDTWKEDYSKLTGAMSVTISATTAENTAVTVTISGASIPTVKNIEALILTAGSGNDTISVGTMAYNDDIRTGGGNDTINVGKGGIDYVDGGAGVDLGIFDWSSSTGNITVDPYWDDYSDGQGRSVNFDNVERFSLTGGSGNDYLAGDVTNDVLNGGMGRDTLDGSRGADNINGGDGIDVWKADYSTSTTAIKITLTAKADTNEVISGITAASVKNIERLSFSSGSGNDVISAGTFANNDNIYTNGGDDTINVGYGGQDYVNGGDGVDLGMFNWSTSTTNITVDAYWDDYADSEGRNVNFDNVDRFNLIGGKGNDHLAGGVYADSLTGGDGRDTLESGSGADVLNGGNGVDMWNGDYSASTTAIKIVLSNVATANEVLGGIKGAKVTGVEQLHFTSGSGNDSISSGSLAYDDWISTGGGDDTVNIGNGGADYVNAGDGLDIGMFNWGASTSDITVDPYWDDYADSENRSVNFDNVERFNLIGGAGNDHLAGDSWDDTLIGGDGNDMLDSGNFRADVDSFNIDSIDGGNGVDFWRADFSQSTESINILLSDVTDANVVLAGITDGVNSALVKNVERMDFTSGSGNDVISSATFAFNDTVHSGEGDDEINVGAGGRDYVDGGAGVDIGVFDWSNSTTGIDVDAYWDDFSDLEGRYVNFDNVERFNVTGGSGSDYLTGDSYSDTLIGGAGDDELDDFGGDDTLTGGDGNDMFDVRTGNGNDVITDFSAGSGVGDLVYFVNFRPFENMSFDVIKQHLTQDGEDAVLSVSDVDAIRFVGVNMDSFVADDFLWN